MYFQNRQLYDSIRGIAYLVQSVTCPEKGINWIWETAPKRFEAPPDLEMLAKLYVVRLRLPWGDLRNEWLISKEELHAHSDDFQVIDVFLRVRAKDSNTEMALIDPLEFETNRDKYEVLEARYLVAWKSSLEDDKKPYWNSESRVRALDIDPDSFTTWMQQ
jgi:hypothetical protein